MNLQLKLSMGQDNWDLIINKKIIECIKNSPV